ncbi:MAG: hypothetical protein ACREDR_36320, partial [Blastocatellia bacterium]
RVNLANRVLPSMPASFPANRVNHDSADSGIPSRFRLFGTRSNHALENLTVLCLEHHEQTQIKGGFGKKLKYSDIIRYRDDWLKRVAANRDRIDELIVQYGAGKKDFASVVADDEGAPANHRSPHSDKTIIGFLHALPHLRRAAYVAAKLIWDSGISSEMVQGSYDAIDLLERVWIRLAAFYPPNHFGERPAHYFFSDFLTSRFTWHRQVYEPRGPGSAGTIVTEIVGSNVLEDAANAIAQTVEGLYVGLYLDDFDLAAWRRAWIAAGNVSMMFASEAAE